MTTAMAMRTERHPSPEGRGPTRGSERGEGLCPDPDKAHRLTRSRYRATRPLPLGEAGDDDCYRCSPGCRRAIRSALMPIRTGSNGLRRRATSVLKIGSRPGWPTSCEHGAGRTDAILLAIAHRAVMAADRLALAEVNDLALALAPSPELRLETRQQGRSFLDTTLAAWPAPGLSDLAAALDGEVAYPVAVGVAAASHGLPLLPTERGVPARLHAESGLGRPASRAHRPDGRHAGPGGARARRRGARAERRSRSARTTSAAPRSGPISAPSCTKPNTRGCSAHDLGARALARRHRRTGRLRQDGAHGGALQGVPRPLRSLRHHQRHLHQGGRAPLDGGGRLAGGAHHGRRDRRLPAYRHPRGRLHQSRGHRRDARASSPPSTSS